MEKKIVITSNGCLNKYENTLCSFRNEIPKQHLPTHKRWKLGIESIGIFCEFLNEAVSKNNTHPALLFFSKGYLIEMLGNDILASDRNKDVSSRQSLNLNMFHPSQRYYLNKNKDYDLKTLNSLFTEQTLLYYNHKKNFIIRHQNTYDPKFIGFPTSFDESTGYLEFGQFGFSYLDEKLRAYLLFHETFYHHLHVTNQSGIKVKFTENKDYYQVKVDDQIYYWGLFRLSDRVDRFETFKTTPNWNILKSKLIGKKEKNLFVKNAPFYTMKVLSIKSQLSIPKLIKILCPNVKPIMYNESFCKEIGILSLSKKDIGTYLYKNFQTLENFVLQELNPEFLKIELVDEFDNPLRLKSGPPTLVKAHLTSAEMNTVIVRVSSHKNEVFHDNKNNKFTIKLPKKLQFFGKEPKIGVSSVLFWNRLCYLSDLDLSYRIVDVNGINDFWTQNPIKDHDELYGQFKENIKPWITVKTLTFGNIVLEAKEKVILTLGKDIAFFLGWRDSPGNSYGTIELNAGEKFMSQFPRQNFPLFPNFMFLYSNCVKPSLVGGNLHELLKIIPVSTNKSDCYQNIEFEIEEFLPLANSEIQFIYFELRSHSGKLIEFVGQPEIYLCMKFIDE